MSDETAIQDEIASTNKLAPAVTVGTERLDDLTKEAPVADLTRQEFYVLVKQAITCATELGWSRNPEESNFLYMDSQTTEDMYWDSIEPSQEFRRLYRYVVAKRFDELAAANLDDLTLTLKEFIYAAKELIKDLAKARESEGNLREEIYSLFDALRHARRNAPFAGYAASGLLQRARNQKSPYRRTVLIKNERNVDPTKCQRPPSEPAIKKRAPHKARFFSTLTSNI
jgi:hypothetical protein